LATSARAHPEERTWSLAAAFFVGLVLFTLSVGLLALALDFSARRGFLPLYGLTDFQRSLLVVLLASPIEFGILSFTALRIGKRPGFADLLRSVGWVPRLHDALYALLGAACYGAIALVKLVLFHSHGSNWKYGFDGITVSLWLLCNCLAQPFIEEFYFRGILFAAMRRRFGSAAAILSSALLFAALHPRAITILGIGLLLGVVRDRTRSLSVCLAVHAGYNAAILLFSSVNW